MNIHHFEFEIEIFDIIFKIDEQAIHVTLKMIPISLSKRQSIATVIFRTAVIRANTRVV